MAAPCLRARLQALAGTVVALAAFASCGVARAETPYCARARARAASDAALLMGPRIAVQGLRFPTSGAIDFGETTGNGYQARGLVELSPIGFWKGLRVLGVGDALCSEHAARVDVEQALERAVDAARAASLRAEATYLTGERDTWRAGAARAEARLASRVITVTDFLEVQRSVDALERRLLAASADAARLEARGAGPAEPLAPLAARYAADAQALERAEARARLLEGWDARITGGVIPSHRNDWFGVVEVSFNLGWPVRAAREARHGEARRRELETADYELPGRLAGLRAQVSAELRRAERELEVIERELGALRRAGEALRGAESPGAAHARDVVAAQLIGAGSERVRLRSFVDALTPMTGGSPDAGSIR